MDIITLSPEAKHGLEGTSILNLVDIPSKNLVAFVCEDDARIRLYNNDSDGKLVHIFANHVSKHVEMVHLCDDVLCSLGSNGEMFSWLAGSGNVLETFNVVGPTGLRKLNDTRLAVIMDSGCISVLQHMKGIGIKKLHDIAPSHSSKIIDLQGTKSALAILGNDGAVEVWNHMTRTKLASIEVEKNTDFVEMSDNFLAFSSRGEGILRVHKNRRQFAYLGSIDFKKYLPKVRRKYWADIQELVFISSNLLVVLTCRIGIYFISLPSLEVNARFDFGCDLNANSITILRNGTVFVGGEKGHCATFQAPERYRDEIKKFADRFYKIEATSAALASKRSSSHDQGQNITSGPRKRTRKQFEKEGEGVQVSTGMMKNLEREMQKLELALAKKQWDIEHLKASMKITEERINVTEAARQEQTQKTREILDMASAVQKEEMEKMQETSRMHAEAQKEERKKRIAAMTNLEEELKKLEVMLGKKDWDTAKIVQDLQYQKEETKKVQESSNKTAESHNETMRKIQAYANEVASDHREEMRKMLEETNSALEAQKEETRKMHENSKVEIEAVSASLKEEMRKILEHTESELKAQKEEKKR